MSPQELQLMSAILRIEERSAAMAAMLGADQCPCCVGAALGGTFSLYGRLQRKRDRCEAWLEVLRAKRCGDEGRIKRANASYGKMVKRHRALETRR